MDYGIPANGDVHNLPGDICAKTELCLLYCYPRQVGKCLSGHLRGPGRLAKDQDHYHDGARETALKSSNSLVCVHCLANLHGTPIQCVKSLDHGPDGKTSITEQHNHSISSASVSAF